MPEISHKRILVAIETDATRYHGEHATRPYLLDRAGSEQMLAHLATDLAAQFPEIKSCALSLTGALFDQTQLLRPAFPIFASLESMLTASFAGQDFQPRLFSIGAESGLMPAADLQPLTDIPLGLLQTLPLLVTGNPELIEQLSETMEHRFMESGQLSAQSARALEASFGISVNHARFMTLTDLNAMLHLQLEHFGFLPLWQLLDAAINTPHETLSVKGSAGQAFSWNGSAVRGVFQTFDHWARDGAGKAQAGGGQMLAQGYADWTREYRQFLTTLSAHEIPVEQVLPGNTEEALKGSFLVETSSFQPRQESIEITEHSSGELGTVAVTVTRNGGQYNYYPLVPAGLNELHACVRETLDGTAEISFPGCIVYDEHSRQMRPDHHHAGTRP